MLSEFFDFAQVGGKRGRRKGTKKPKKGKNKKKRVNWRGQKRKLSGGLK